MYAEHLIDTARLFLAQSEFVIYCKGSHGRREFEIVKLSIKFHRMPLEFKFRAMVENWSRSKIVSEMSAYIP